MKWDFHPEALEEYESAASYYAERDPELQLRFIDRLRIPSSEYWKPRPDGV
jgi:hypothetical protein